MTELEPLVAIKGGLLLPRTTNPFPELDQALSSSWKIYSSHPISSSIRFLPPLGRKPAKPSFACSKPPSSIGKLISLSLKIAKPVKA